MQWVRLGFFVLAAAFGCLPAHAAETRHEVLAFYYGWYGSPSVTGRWVHWKGVDAAAGQIANAADYPVLGAYDSHNPSVVDRQAVMARAAGVTGFIASWWGQGSFEDQSMPLLLAAAERHGLAVSAYLEKLLGQDEAERRRSAVAQLGYLLARYGVDPAWLRAGGRPVIFIYGRAADALPPAAWREVAAEVRRQAPEGVALIGPPALASVLDGAHVYNVTAATHGLDQAKLRAWADARDRAIVAATRPKIACLTVIPGYDDTRLGRPLPRPTTARDGGAVYSTLWEAAIAADPDWILITSWNEWHEGSEIEPSRAYHDSFLRLTGLYARKFLSLPR